MNIVAGSYEKYILGWTLNHNKQGGKSNGDEEQEVCYLNSTFTYPAHMAPIKCLAMAGPVLVTGGMDDAIKIFDVAAYCEVGSLLHHSAAITSLSFYGDQCYGKAEGNDIAYPRNLLSGSLDGNICIWDSDLWVHLKTMKAHKKGVNDLAIHPSGRLALSVGRDCHLSMFNLIKGRCTFTSNLQKEATLIEFNSRVGDSYSVGIDEVVSVHNAEDARLLHSLQHSKRVLCLSPAQNGLLLTGGEDSTIRAWDLASGKISFSLENAHKNRIKGLSVLGPKTSIESDDAPYLVTSASSDGIIRVWDVRMVKRENSTPLSETDSKARITCLASSTSNRLRKAQAFIERDLRSEKGELMASKKESKAKRKSKESNLKEDSHPSFAKKKKSKKLMGIKKKKGMKKKGVAKHGKLAAALS
uniref:Uncharacterized protein n=1 Tax=Araucaria cunninghamii TaxID=56994 RepID=A0A0D6R7M5_ARACU